MALRHKFNAKRQEVDGINFDSKMEARYYQKLKDDEDTLFFLRQVPIHLPGTVYRCDFLEFKKNGLVLFTDVKGMETNLFKVKKKMVEQLYPITINVVKKV